jgi:metal-responsive CopG/Arc/MetJ family transcriptional regulator
MGRMNRTQIYLEPELSEALDRLARKRSTSRAAIIRLAAHDLVTREEAGSGSILELAGIGRSGLSDVSERHDEYLAEDEMARWSL